MKHKLKTNQSVKNVSAQFSVLTSTYPKVLSKEIRIDKKGSVIKTPSANLCRGKVCVKSVSSIREFADLLLTLEQNQALTYGVPKKGLTKAEIVTKKDFDQAPQASNVITRTEHWFEWPSGAGIMMLDYDPDDHVFEKEAVLEILYEVCPEMKKVEHVWWVSSSSHINNTETGEEVAGVKGQRIYFIVDKASDIPRAAKVLGERLWLAGYGQIRISATGAMLERVPFDMNVYQPSRLDFAAGASCIPPLSQVRGIPSLIEGNATSLNTTTAFPSLNISEKRKLQELKAGKKVVATPNAEKVRLDYAKAMKLKINKPDICETDEDMLSIIEHIFDTGELPPFWILHVWNGSELVEVTVQDILWDKPAFDGMLCLDPIEPEYDEYRLVGKLFLNQHKPCLFSFARGQRTFSLEEFKHNITIEGNLTNAVNDTLDILEKRKDAFNYGGILVTPMNKTLNYLDHPKMKHLLGGFIQYWTLKKKCNPTNELVDGVASIGVVRNLNPITGFVDHPVIDSKLRMLLKPGYNHEMKMLGDFDYSYFDIVDRRLTVDEIEFHLMRLWAPFTGFEFAGNEDRTVVIAAVFSAVLRQVLPTCPVFAFDAPTQGTGKTLLAETVGIIASGRKPSALAPGKSSYDEEFRKRLMALFLNGEPVVNFDNIVGIFDSPSFAAAITSEHYEDRILGKSKTSKILNKTLFLMTGNNMQIVGDMSRRVLKARLLSKNNKLAMRKYDFDPRAKVFETRFEIISSVLSLINHWKHSGQPKLAGTMTTFSEWDLLVRQPLAFIGQQFPETGILDLLDISLKQQDDSSDKDALIALLKALCVTFGIGKRFKASDILHQPLESKTLLADAIYAFESRQNLQSSQHIGIMLKRFLQNNVEGLVLKGKKISGSWTYWVELTDDTHRPEIMTMLKHTHVEYVELSKVIPQSF